MLAIVEALCFALIVAGGAAVLVGLLIVIRALRMR
jgi:hypothetical protein